MQKSKVGIMHRLICTVVHKLLLQEGTGRIVMWTSMGIRNSYTMEVGVLMVAISRYENFVHFISLECMYWSCAIMLSLILL